MRVLTIIAAAMMLAAAPAHADGVSKSEIAKILSDQGYNVRDQGPQALGVTVDRFVIYIMVAGKDADISYMIEFPELRGDLVSPDILNKFNTDVKFGRVYVDRDGYLTLQMDRNSAGGVSIENVESDFDVFLTLIWKFLNDLESQRVA